MKTEELSPEIRHAALRLIEMWRVMNNSFNNNIDRFLKMRARMYGTTRSFIVVGTKTDTSDRILEGLCKIETLYEQEDIAEQFDALMNMAWSKLTERDKFVLDPYRRDSELEEKNKKICECYSVSHFAVRKYKDIAYGHLWDNLSAEAADAHQLAFDLIYDWRILECELIGKMMRRIYSHEVNRLESDLMETGIPVQSKDECMGADYPCIYIEPNWIISGKGSHPYSVQLHLISKMPVGALEKLVEELLARRRCVYQIFRFKTYSGGYRLHAVYELPIERDDILQQQEIRCCLTQVRDDMQKCA